MQKRRISQGQDTDGIALRSQLSKSNMIRKGHTANIESGRIETEPDVDHVFSNLPNSIVPLIEGVEGMPESHTIPSAHGRSEGHEDVQDEDCGKHEDHELPEHCSE
jgi:hypothetical protein